MRARGVFYFTNIKPDEAFERKNVNMLCSS